MLNSLVSHSTIVAFFETGPGSLISGGMFEPNANVGQMIPRTNLLVNIYGFPTDLVSGGTYLVLCPLRMLPCTPQQGCSLEGGVLKERAQRGFQWRTAKNTNAHSPFPKPII